MAEKASERRLSLEATLQALLELTGWQAELVRAAIRQVSERPPTRCRRRRHARRHG